MVQTGAAKRHFARIEFKPFTEQERTRYEEVVGKLVSSCPLRCYEACSTAGINILPEADFTYNEKLGVKHVNASKDSDAALENPVPEGYESEWGIMTGACDCEDMASPTWPYRTIEAFNSRRRESVPCKHITALIHRLAFLMGKDKDVVYRMRGLTPCWALPHHVLRRAELGNTYVDLATTIDLTTGKIMGPSVLPRLYPLALPPVCAEREEAHTSKPVHGNSTEEPASSQELDWGEPSTQVRTSTSIMSHDNSCRLFAAHARRVSQSCGT